VQRNHKMKLKHNCNVEKNGVVYWTLGHTVRATIPFALVKISWTCYTGASTTIFVIRHSNYTFKLVIPIKHSN